MTSDADSDARAAGGVPGEGDLDALYRELRERLLADVERTLASGRAGAGAAEPGGGYVEEMIRAITAVPAAMLSGESGAARAADEGDQTELVAVMGQAYLAWITRGFHFWGRLAEHHGSYYARLIERLAAMKANPEGMEEERRALMDDTSAFLREVSDLSMREARVLQRDLETVGREMQGLMDADAGTDRPRRSVKVKP